MNVCEMAGHNYQLINEHRIFCTKCGEVKDISRPVSCES